MRALVQTAPTTTAPAGPVRAIPVAAPAQQALLQRQCDRCDEEDRRLQRWRGPRADLSRVPPIVHDVLQSPGELLDPATRARFEPHFGHDFAHVRIHADERAARSAAAVNALAYTVGGHIVFGAGGYAPRARKGQRLLAHELAHVVQQQASPALSLPLPATAAEGGGRPRITQVTAAQGTASPQLKPIRMGDAGDPLERQADRAAETALSATAPGLQPRRSTASSAVPLASAGSVLFRTRDRRLDEVSGRIREIAGPYTTEGLVEQIFDETSGINLQDPDNLRPIANLVAETFQPDVLMQFLSRVGASAAPREEVPQEGPTAEEEARMQQQIAMMQVGRRGPYGQYGPGVLLPVVTQLGRPLVEPLMHAFQSAGGFVSGLYEGIQQTVSPQDAQLFAQQLMRSTILTAVFPLPFVAGAAVGIGEDVYQAIRGLIRTIANLPEVISATTELIRRLLSDQGAEFARRAGQEIGREYGQNIIRMSRSNIIRFTYDLGRMVGPTIVYTVLAFLGVPEALAGALIGRLLTVLRPLLQRFPRVVRLLERIAQWRGRGRGRRRLEREALDAEVEQSFAATFEMTPEEGGALPSGQGVVTQAPEIAAGFSQVQAQAFRRFLSRSFADPDIQILQQL